MLIWFRGGALTFSFSDERCVPPEHEDSNFRFAHSLLLSKVPIPASNIHRFRGEKSPEDAASEYEQELRAVMGGSPRFDLIILGMGEDTHTASLFPGSPAIQETERWSVAVYVDKLGAFRLTLTPPILNNARQVAILALGQEKASAVYDVYMARSIRRLTPFKSFSRPTVASHGSSTRSLPRRLFFFEGAAIPDRRRCSSPLSGHSGLAACG